MMNIRKLHPGVYIKDALEAMEMSAKEFSLRTGISERTLSAIINAKGDITFEVAYKLSQFFDDTVNFWINLQNQYSLYLKEEEKKQSILNDWNLIKNIKKYLLINNYISSEDDIETIVHKVRKLVGVTNLTLLDRENSFICFKQHKTAYNQNSFLQNFWIALALNEARKNNCNTYNKNKLKSSINEIRALMFLEPDIFYPRIKEIFNDCGINFIILPYLSKSNIYGVTKWFSRDNVMIAVSNRGGKADLFWFTIFHEISHVLMEHRRDVLVNEDGDKDNEADQMASNLLIPKEKWDEFINNNVFTPESIDSFSKKVGVLPCIVLGRLHKEKDEIIPYGKYDSIFNVTYNI